jgi:hypothetical protein
LKIGVWSGGGVDYAAHWVNKLGLAHLVSWVDTKSRLPEMIAQGAILFIDDKMESSDLVTVVRV